MSVPFHAGRRDDLRAQQPSSERCARVSLRTQARWRPAVGLCAAVCLLTFPLTGHGAGTTQRASLHDFVAPRTTSTDASQRRQATVWWLRKAASLQANDAEARSNAVLSQRTQAAGW